MRFSGIESMAFSFVFFTLAWPPVTVGYNFSHSWVKTADSPGSNWFFVLSKIEATSNRGLVVEEEAVTNLDHR
jgi:hypothetical protein